MTEFLDLYIDDRLDQSATLSAEVPASSVKAGLLAVDAELEHDGAVYYVSELEDVRNGTASTRRVEALALWYRLGDIRRPGSTVLTTETVAAGLELLLTGTDWNVGDATLVDPAVFSMEEQDMTVLALVRNWAKVTGAAAVFNTSTRTIDLVAERGRDLGVAFRYGRNVQTVRRRVSPPTATVLYAYGADDLTIAGINSGRQYVEDFSFYTAQGISIGDARARYTRTEIFADSSFVDEAALLAAANTRLAELSQASINYECSVVDLSELTGVDETPTVGDRVRVTDPEFGDDLRATVVRTKRHPLQPWLNEVELAFIVSTPSAGASTSRPSTALTWEQFISNNLSEQRVRNDSLYTVSRLPLSFRNGGKANYHLDIFATGVGAGTLYVEVVDTATDTIQHRALEIAYTDGQELHENVQWAYEDLAGDYDYRVRVYTVAAGGPSISNGVNILADESRFWILAQGAIRQTPTTPNSIRYEYDFAFPVYTFQVPDGVTTLTAEVVAGASGPDNRAGVSAGGAVAVEFPVTPGELIDIVVGDQGDGNDDPAGGGTSNWNGGRGNKPGSSPSGGASGGGSSHVIRSGFAYSAALVVAGAGGGGNEGDGASGASGGQGGFYEGGAGSGGSHLPTRHGAGGTQFAGGIGGVSATSNPGQAGAANLGGNGALSTSSSSFGSGGGGGGWYGGGGGCEPTSIGYGGVGGAGGGGCGWAGSGVIVTSISDGSNVAAGYVVLSWDVPDEV
jgi:hypothetical protein